MSGESKLILTESADGITYSAVPLELMVQLVEQQQSRIVEILLFLYYQQRDLLNGPTQKPEEL